MQRLSDIKAIAIVFGIAACISAFAAGCQTESRTTRTSKQHVEITLPGSDTPVCVIDFASDGQTRATAPGATSQPTISEVDDAGARSSASGQQLPPTLPKFAYAAKEQVYIFYGLGAVCVVAGIVLIVKQRRQLGAGLLIAGSVLILAKTFVDVYAIYAVPLLIIGGACWGIAHIIEKKKRADLEARKTENRETLKRALVSDDPDTIKAVVESSPAGRDAAADLARGVFSSSVAKPSPTA